MDAIAVLGLVGLALVDSTSVGTLVLPLVLLLAPRLHVGRFCVFLATVAGFYAVVGIVLVAGAGWLVGVASGLGESRGVRWAELLSGGLMLAVGILGDPRRWFGRRRAAVDEAKGPDRTAGRTAGRTVGWQDRLSGPDASYGAVVGVGVVAALIEVGSMLPFLAAVAIITRADLPVVGWVSVVLGYTVVMVLPALVLLGLRLALGQRVERSLTRVSAWLNRQTGDAVFWVLAIVGLLLVGDASSVLFA